MLHADLKVDGGCLRKDISAGWFAKEPKSDGVVDEAVVLIYVLVFKVKYNPIWSKWLVCMSVSDSI